MKDLDNFIHNLAVEMQHELIACRRDFHKYPETAWTEFRTASLIAAKLESLGYDILTGQDIFRKDAMLGVPTTEILTHEQERALAQGGISRYIAKFTDGQTGVVGLLDTGVPGPVIALRFDIDANALVEADCSKHRACREGFASVNSGVMHACGHDGHSSIGLGIAKILAILQQHHKLAGIIKLIFQPAEEGVRGARAIAKSGIVDDVQYLIGLHLGFQAQKTSQIICGTNGFLATTKLDASFSGKPAHAGAAPHTGHNALLAAATAAIQLHAISRHGDGSSRINVGVLQAGSARNIIASQALLQLETRGATTVIDEYMQQEAQRVITCAAALYNVAATIKEVGQAPGGNSDSKLANLLQAEAIKANLWQEIIPASFLGASDDFTWFMERVRLHGGQSVYAQFGADRPAGHHEALFDFDESVLPLAVEIISKLVLRLAANADRRDI